MAVQEQEDSPQPKLAFFLEALFLGKNGALSL
jgi:hypothetical protein